MAGRVTAIKRMNEGGKAREIVGRGFISSTNRLIYAACAPIITSAIRLSRALLRVSTRLPRRVAGVAKRKSDRPRSAVRVSKNAAATHISVGRLLLSRPQRARQ